MTNIRAKALEALESWFRSPLSQGFVYDGMKEKIREALSEPRQLTTIAAILQHWIDFDTDARNKEGLETTDSTHIMAPPTWPSHGQLKNWIATLSEPKWKSMDSAPRDGTQILVASTMRRIGHPEKINSVANARWCECSKTGEEFWHDIEGIMGQEDVELWMHLPDAPTGEKS